MTERPECVARRTAGTVSATANAGTDVTMSTRNPAVQPDSRGSPFGWSVLVTTVAHPAAPMAAPMVRKLAFMPLATPVCGTGTLLTTRLAMTDAGDRSPRRPPPPVSAVRNVRLLSPPRTVSGIAMAKETLRRATMQSAQWAV